MSKSYTVVIGNEKGGSGKTTICIHLIACLLRCGASVGSIDLDGRQLSLTAYTKNRKRKYPSLPHPEHIQFMKPDILNADLMAQWYEDNLTVAINKLSVNNDFIIIDTAAGDHVGSRDAHSMADRIITPVNESFIDMALLIDRSSEKSIPGVYSNMIWAQKIKRLKRGLKVPIWNVMRNRATHISSHNRVAIDTVLLDASRRLGFKIVPGLSERVVYRELFNEGLTLIDIGEGNMKASYITARQELRCMLKALGIHDFEVAFS